MGVGDALLPVLQPRVPEAPSPPQAALPLETKEEAVFDMLLGG